MTVARQAYRLMLVGAEGAGKRTAQQYLVQQWGAQAVSLYETAPGYITSNTTSEEKIAKWGAKRPLIAFTCSNVDTATTYQEFRGFKMHIVELCRTKGMADEPPDDVIANTGSLLELQRRLDHLLPPEVQRACRNQLARDSIQYLPPRWTKEPSTTPTLH